MKPWSAFANRMDAAKELVTALDAYRGRKPLVLAIPRGAVPMGKYIADHLGGDFDIVLVRKIGAPMDPECAIGAVDETGWAYLSPFAQRFINDDAFIEREKAEQLALLRKRRAEYTPYRHPIDPAGRLTIIVDDGIATGATMIAALHATRAKKPAELICAAPVASKESLEDIRPLADKVVCLHVPEFFGAVGRFYRSFSQVDDDEVIRVLAESGRRGDDPAPAD
ncbi:MAG TPA: phosphoribosyltransferase family protein [Noviherbaspirillum sp.]